MGSRVEQSKHYMDLDPITEYIHDQLQYMLQENGLRTKKELYGIPSVPTHRW